MGVGLGEVFAEVGGEANRFEAGFEAAFEGLAGFVSISTAEVGSDKEDLVFWEVESFESLGEGLLVGVWLGDEVALEKLTVFVQDFPPVGILVAVLVGAAQGEGELVGVVDFFGLGVEDDSSVD